MIRGQKRKIKEPTVKLNTNIHNRFDVEVMDAKTGKIKQRAQGENIILNSLWECIFNPTDWNRYIHYGCGAGTPAATDTSLFTFSGYGVPSDPIYNLDHANDVLSATRKITLSETTAVGVTLTEVGIASYTTPTSLCTHAMLKDMNGNPISINKTNTDIINIYATVFVHFSGNFRKYIGFAESSRILKLALGLIDSLDQNGNYAGLAGYSVSKHLSAQYSLSEKKITLTISRVNTTEGNDTKGLVKYYVSRTSIYVDDEWFPGSDIIGEAIATADGTCKDFGTKFGFIKSGSKIYIDGVEQTTGVSVDEGVPNVSEDSGLTSILRPVDDYGHLYNYNYYTCSIDGSQTIILYNPYYTLFGLTGIRSSSSDSFELKVSNDLSTWIYVGTIGDSWISTGIYKNYKYWKCTNNSKSSDAYIYCCSSELSTNNIHFDTAPIAGSIITSDYSTAIIAKDENHVFDMTMVVQIGEYTS